MAQPAVSVVVVSHGRPESLMWCLTALAGQAYETFEIVVVADSAGAARVAESDFAGQVKLVPFDEANISAARNKGIAAAAGEIIAFVDDDAAAEPMWLYHLVHGLSATGAAAAGGYVRGRNGISFQWRARMVDYAGRAIGIAHEGLEPFVPALPESYAVKTEGTNMAVRRQLLEDLGGFDEGYRFFLDETDLNLRLAEAGHTTVLCPMAEVHHAYRASTRRQEDRAVIDLTDVGASTVVMLRKFGEPEEPRLAELRKEQSDRVADQLRRGLQSKETAEAALESLERGIEEGRARAFGQYPSTLAENAPFLSFPARREGHVTLEGRPWQAAGLRKQAEELAARGLNVSLFIFGLNARFHHVRFRSGGYWEQTGGQFGRSERNQPLVRLVGFKSRVVAEQARTRHARG